MPIGVIKDPSIIIKPGPKLVDFITTRIKDIEKSPEGIKALKSSTKKQRSKIILRIVDIKWLNEYLKEWRKTSDENFYIHEFLDDSTIELPEPEVTPRNPELEARIQKLILQQNARDYRAMTKSVDSIRKNIPEDTIAYQSK